MEPVPRRHERTVAVAVGRPHDQEEGGRRVGGRRVSSHGALTQCGRPPGAAVAVADAGQEAGVVGEAAPGPGLSGPRVLRVQLVLRRAPVVEEDVQVALSPTHAMLRQGLTPPCSFSSRFAIRYRRETRPDGVCILSVSRYLRGLSPPGCDPCSSQLALVGVLLASYPTILVVFAPPNSTVGGQASWEI